VNCVNIVMCKHEFLAVHGLKNSSCRVENIAKNIYLGQSMPVPDQRGKHSNRLNNVPTESLECVHRHIAKTPQYRSHYSRNQISSKACLDCDLTVAPLYRQYYLPQCQAQYILPVSEDKYRIIFCISYNTGFKLPKFDMCKECDYLNTWTKLLQRRRMTNK
jgi:hypothetical protein